MTQFEYQGFGTLLQWNGALQNGAAANAFSAIASTGANSVAINPEIFVANGTSNSLVTSATKSTSDADLIAGIKQAQADGLKVLLEPQIGGLDGTLSFNLHPTDPNAFFASYKATIVHLATIAQQTGVDTLGIGNEMNTLSGSAYRSQWLDIIAAVRQVYSGKITYKAATNEASSVSFWDAVDTIGVNAYLPLSASGNPSISDLAAAWTTASADPYWAKVLNGESIVDFMHSLSTTYGKQVLITEVGYRSITGSASDPGNWAVAGTADQTAQANAYKALFQVLSQQGGSWLSGLSLWDYELNTDAAGTNYTPFGKAAQAVVQQYFTNSAPVSGLTITGSAIGDLIDVGDGNNTINAGLGNDVIRVGAGNDTIVAGPQTISRLKTTTVTIQGYGSIGTDGKGAQVALLINGQQVGATVTFTPASDVAGYQTYTFTFANPDQINSMDVALMSASTKAYAYLGTITINGAKLSGSDITNLSAPGTFDLYNTAVHLDAGNYQDWFYGAQTDNDLIYVGSGNDTIDGGAGTDTVVFTGAFSDYALTRSGSALTVTDSVAGRNGQDTLTNVEYLQFSDQRVAVASLVLADGGSGAASSLMTPLISAATVSAPVQVMAAARMLVAFAATSTPTPSAAPQIAVSGVSAANSTVNLLNGTTVLATTTADASGNYSFTVGNVPDGLYTLAAQATLGSLTSGLSSTTSMVIGSSADIAGLIASAPSVPAAIYLTDPSNPVVVSVAQLSTIASALGNMVTGYSLAVSDTAANVVGALSTLGTQANLASITLTDSHVFTVSQAAMRQIISTDASVLSKITGGYSFQAVTTNAGVTSTAAYDASGAWLWSSSVKAVGSSVETWTQYADGSIRDSYSQPNGTKISDNYKTSTGSVYTVYNITGKPYTTAVYNYDVNGKLFSATSSYASGVTYCTQNTASDGTMTTVTYDTSGNKAQQVIASSNGTTETTNYGSGGAVLTDTIASKTGSQYTQYGITGQAYTSVQYVYNSAGKLTASTQYYANGNVCAAMTTGSDGTVTTATYDQSNHMVAKYIVSPNGTKESIGYTAAGAKTSDWTTTADGTTTGMQYGITGQAYASMQSVYNSAGKLTASSQYYANGNTYATMTTAANGTVTTSMYDQSNHIASQYINSTNGTRESIAYTAAGAKTSDWTTTADGTTSGMQYGITGQPYASMQSVYNSAGKLIASTQYYANGNTYATMTTAADGTVTTSMYDQSNHITSQYIVSPNGTKESIGYTAAGAKTSDWTTTAAGVTTGMQYGITGQAYASMQSVYNSAGKLTASTQYYASGAIYSAMSTATDGTVTTSTYDTSSHLTAQYIVSPNGTKESVGYTTAGAKVSDTVTTANSTTVTQYGITGQAYSSVQYVYSTAGKLTAATQFYANGNTYSAMTTASDGTATTVSYDTSGNMNQKRIVSPTGSTHTSTYDASGKMLTDATSDATGTHWTQMNITGQSYNAMTVDSNAAGALQDIILKNNDGSQSTTFYAAGASLNFNNAHDVISAHGNNTMTFASTPFQDTIQNFHGGDATGHDTIVLAASLASSFSALKITTGQYNTTVAIDAQHSFTMGNLQGPLTAQDFRFV